MDRKRTLNNFLLIKLDKENDSIKLKNGFELYIDISFDPEKHATVTGEVVGLPSRLEYTGKPNLGMPWLTDMELNYGDKVIIYYLSIINALKPDSKRYIFEGDDRYVIISYSSVYAVYGEGFVRPINGYVLIEPTDDPWWTDVKKRMEKIGLEAVKMQQKTNTNVTFGKVKYLGKPNREYVDEYATDEGCDIAKGDTVVLRRTNDIPLHYDLHAKIDKGTKLLRIQRRNLLAKI